MVLRSVSARPGESPRRGLAIPFALAVVLLLGGMVAAFHQLMMSSQHSTGKFIEDAVLKRIAEAGVNEAWTRVRQALQDPAKNPKLLDLLRTGSTAPFDGLALPLTESWGKGLVKSGQLQVKCRLRVVDQRQNDSKGVAYFGDEKVGTLGISASAVLTRGDGKPPKTCTLDRFHDFKNLALLTPASGRNGKYTCSAPLDYALLVRNGLKEFEDTQGLSLNPRDQKLLIKQPNEVGKLGKIYFGGTGDQGDGYVFVNVPDEGADMIPAPQPPVPPAVFHTIDRDECIILFPALDEHRSDLKGLKGHFYSKMLPILPAVPPPALPTDPIDRIILQEFQAMAEVASGPMQNTWPGVELLGPWKEPMSGAAVQQCLEGRLRQRFRYAVAFRLDPSDVDHVEAKQKAAAWAFPAPCIPSATLEKITTWPDSKYLEIAPPLMKGIEHLQKNRGPELWPLVSRFQTDFPLQPGLPSLPMPPQSPPFPNPRFVNFKNETIQEDMTGWSGFCTFRHTNLLTHRFQVFGELADYGLFDKTSKVLRLSGAVQILTQVTIPEDITIEGQGAILAPGFVLEGGIKKKSASDLCVLVALEGPIWIETDHPIEAGLIATDIDNGTQGRLHPTKALNLKGAVCVDVLDTPRWATGVGHQIEYDPAFRVDQPVYTHFLSPWISYQRQVFDS